MMDKIKKLRERTDVGILECKKALEVCNGDIESSVEYLRKQGLIMIQDNDGETTEGVVESYIHYNRKVGVLVKVTCQTDFVAKTPDFIEFVNNVAMQVAVTNPKAISVESWGNIPLIKNNILEEVKKEKPNLPEQVQEKIVKGKFDKLAQEHVLLEQKFVKNDEITIKEMLGELALKTKENIVIEKFERYEI